jgi:hypothetical protein
MKYQKCLTTNTKKLIEMERVQKTSTIWQWIELNVNTCYRVIDTHTGNTHSQWEGYQDGCRRYRTHFRSKHDRREWII